MVIKNFAGNGRMTKNIVDDLLKINIQVALHLQRASDSTFLCILGVLPRRTLIGMRQRLLLSFLDGINH